MTTPAVAMHAPASLLSDETLRWLIAQDPLDLRSVYRRELARRTLWELRDRHIEPPGWLVGLAVPTPESQWAPGTTPFGHYPGT
jgi:hypothetical protein